MTADAMSISRWIVAALGAAFLLTAGAAMAEVSVIGNGLAAECSTAATGVAGNQPARRDAIHLCTLALENESMSPHETASTHVNRGVLYMTDGAGDDALHDFDAALKIEPTLPEAMVNRGAALIFSGRNAEGAAEITRGLALNPIEPEKAYYNRGVAEERLHDLKGAYFDYKKASELKPDWAMPKNELARFKVSQR